MSRRRHSEVVTVAQRRRGPGAATLPPLVTATATLAWAHCCCGEDLATVVRPDEVAGDVMDAVLRAAGWDPAHNLCPFCRAEERDLAVADGRDTEGCPSCGRRCR